MFYTLMYSDHTVLCIKVLGPGQARPDSVKVHTILSPEDAHKSQWGQITYEIHKSNVFTTLEEANKESFLRKLKGKTDV